MAVFLEWLKARERYIPKKIAHSRENKKNIYIDFIELAKENYKKHKDINFYAKKLNITPTYLSRVTKRTSNVTVIKILDEMILMEACYLINMKTLNMKEIACELGFADQATFTHFFRRYLKISPTEYKNSL